MNEPPNHYLSRLQAALFLAGLALILMGQFLVSATHWLSIPVNVPAIPILGQLRYPPYFGTSFAVIAAGMLMLIGGLYGSSLTSPSDFASTAPLKTGLSPIPRSGLIALGGVALAMTAITIYSAVGSQGKLNPLIWFIELALVGSALYVLDRKNQRQMLLTGRETLLLLGYVILVFGLALLFRFVDSLDVYSRVVFVLAGLGGAFALWRTRCLPGQIIAWLLIVWIGFALYSYNLTSWRYAFVGDEFSFFDYARILAANPDLSILLDWRGVYHHSPVFASEIHAASVALFGVDVYGWRISETIMVFLAAPAVYALARWFMPVRVGLFAVVLFLSSHHLLALSRIGYPTLQSIPPLVVALALFLWSLKRPNLTGIFLSGIASAFAFYTFGIGLPLLPLPLLLLALICIPNKADSPRAAVSGWLRNLWTHWPVIVTFAVAVMLTGLPRLVNPEWLQALSNESIFKSQVEGVSNVLTGQILPNILYTFTASLYSAASSHYTSGGHIDPVSSVLMLVGLASLLSSMPRKRGALLLIACFVVVCTAVGALVPDAYPPNTRTFILVPFYAIFAAIGAHVLWSQANRLRITSLRFACRIAMTAFVFAIPCLNLYQLYVITERTVPKTPISMLAREFQTSSPETAIYYVTRSPFNAETHHLVFDAFKFDQNRFHVILHDENPAGAMSDIAATARTPYRVLIGADVPNREEWLAALQAAWPSNPVMAVRDGTDRLYFDSITVEGPDTPSKNR